MDSRLTDAELIQLVQEKLPEELSLAEIHQLHDRLKQSRELKSVLIGQLHLETYLSTAFAEIQVSVEEIIRRADAYQETKPASSWPLWTGLASLLLLSGIGIFFAMRNPPEPRQLAGDPNAEHHLEDAEKSRNVTKTDAAENPPAPKNNPPRPIAHTKLAENTPPANPDDKPDQVVKADPAKTPQGQPDDPWFEALDPEAPPKSLSETAFEMPGWQEGDFLLKAEAERWLAAAPGHSLRIDEKEADNIRWVELNGVARLKSPWVKDAVLRLSLFDTEHFRIHFWCGEEGVTLWHYPARKPKFWSAYQSRRKKNQPVPAQFTALLTSDDARQDRVRSGVVEFRHQEGSLVMSQGPVRLLTVPLPAAPREVVFEGQCRLSELAMYRGEPLPDTKEPARPLVLSSTRPADLPWMTHRPARDLRTGLRELGQARQQPDEWTETLAEGITASAKEGKVRLAVEKSEQPVHIGTILDRPGLYEVIFRVESASPGTGIYFGDDQGRELHRVGFLRDRRTGRLVFDASPNRKNETEIDADPQKNSVAYFAENHWLRIVWGFGSFKIYSSGDGVHWGSAFSPTRSLPGPFTSIGLMVQKTAEPRQITLSHLEVRELSALTSLASARARELAPPFADLPKLDFGAWNQKVQSSWPLDEDPPIAMADWRRACALRSLAESPWTSLSAALLRGLIEEGLHRDQPLSERFRLLDEVSLLFDLSGGAEAAAMVRMYERLGTMALAEGFADPFGLVTRRLLRAPLWSESNVQVVSPDFTREILLNHAYARQWESLRSVARRTEFWMLSAHPQRTKWWEGNQRELLAWAETLAQHRAPVQGPDNADWIPRISRGRQWQHPLITQVSKEGYNVMAEFEAALASDAFVDACRIITSAGRAGMAGLLPDSKDPDLLVSLPRAIALAMREHPELQEAMRNQFGDVGKIRVREAMSKADEESVRAATVRFFGTEAAAEAYGWLGDRALASGKFAQAAQAYQEGLTWAGSTLARDLQSRLRLAAGLLGHDVGGSEGDTVQIGSAIWTAEQFDHLLDQLRKSHAGNESEGPADWNPARIAANPPAPARFEAVKRNTFAGDLGQGDYNNPATDWVARQLAVAVDGDALFVSNRFQVVCYQLADGKTRWSRGLGGEQGHVQHWLYVPMQPIIVGDRVFVRRLTKRGPELACLASADGKVLWNVRPEHHVASDPVFVQNRLLALVASMPQSGLLQLDLASFHPYTGDVLSQQPLLTLRDEWEGRPPCQITAANGKILCTIGGTTLCCDASGQPHWLRQHPWLPAEVDLPARMHHHQPPIVAEGRVYASQNGVQEVACFDLDTGRQHWSLPAPQLVRLLGLAGECLIVQTDLGFTAIHKASGQIAWLHAAADLLNGQLCGGGHLVYSRTLDDTKGGKICLVWLDANTGTELSHALLKNLAGEKWRFGPLVMHDSKCWAFWAQGFKQAPRELVELVPQTDLPPAGPLHPNPLADWIDNILPSSMANMALGLPGWTLTTSQDFSGEKGVPPLAEFRGERDVLKTRMNERKPVHLVRRVRLPANQSAKLRLRLGHEAGKSWTVKVQLGPQLLLEQVIDDKTAPNGWWEKEIDLTPWSGQTIWLLASQTSPDENQTGAAFWKALEIISR